MLVSAVALLLPTALAWAAAHTYARVHIEQVPVTPTYHEPGAELCRGCSGPWDDEPRGRKVGRMCRHAGRSSLVVPGLNTTLSLVPLHVPLGPALRVNATPHLQ
jgi:hypothetical protein